jgi:hypothetical protein
MLHLTWNFIFDINANMCLHRNGQVAAFLLSCVFIGTFSIFSLKNIKYGHNQKKIGCREHEVTHHWPGELKKYRKMNLGHGDRQS